ncbi:hypothetical protein CL656_03520 [bacterium]|nr:hypothetical protein [bacterium]|tara:strand:- start:1616 stop:2062 length:447 start_codon:yes stop_codon:yes gene_type:complete
MEYQNFKSEVIRASYAGEVRKNIYVPRLNTPYEIDYIKKVLFAEHFDEKMQSARLDDMEFNNLSKEENIMHLLNFADFNSLNWNFLKLYNNSSFKNIRMIVINNSVFCTVEVIHSYYVINNRLICCDPSEPAFGFGSIATAGNGAFVK